MTKLNEEAVRAMEQAPNEAFDTPAAVLDDERLSTPQRIQILEAWEHLALEAVKAAEGEAARAAQRRLGEVENALAKLVTLASGGDAGITLNDDDGRVFE